MKTWFKFYGPEFLSDPKMLSLTAVERALWLTILCLASTSEEEGTIRYISESKIMTLTSLDPLDDEWRENEGFLGKFETLGMIELFNEDGKDVILVRNFTRRQEKDLTNAERQARFRAKHRKDNVDSNGSNVTKVTLEKNRIEKIRKYDGGNTPITPSTPPSSGSQPSGYEAYKKKAESLKSKPKQEHSDFSDEEKAILEEGQSPAMVAKGVAAMALKLVLALGVYLTLSLAPVEARTVQVQYKLNLTRPSYQVKSQKVSTPTSYTREQKNTASNVKVARAEIENKILEKFGKDGKVALAIARCESGLRPFAVGDGHIAYWQDGVEYGKSYGVFQVRHLPGRPSPDQLLDADYNINYAYNLYKRSGFYPWSAYTNGCYKSFLSYVPTNL